MGNWLKVPCAHCRGEGYNPASDFFPCSACRGERMVRVLTRGDGVPIACPDCDGTGNAHRETGLCAKCGGRGWLGQDPVDMAYNAETERWEPERPNVIWPNAKDHNEDDALVALLDRLKEHVAKVRVHQESIESMTKSLVERKTLPRSKVVDMRSAIETHDHLYIKAQRKALWAWDDLEEDLRQLYTVDTH